MSPADTQLILTALGIPTHIAALLIMFWFIDRRLVRIETRLHMREDRREMREV
jgi:hypothetical protein